MSQFVARGLGPAVAFLLLILPGLTSAQDTGQVLAGRRLVEAEQKSIFFAMHPTASLQSVDYDGVQKTPDGFMLTYTFNFKGAFDLRFNSRMDFVFDGKGRLAGLQAGQTSCPVPPFTAANLAMGFLKDMVKDDLELKKDGVFARALDAADARLVLELILKSKQSNAPPLVIQPVVGVPGDPQHDTERAFQLMKANDHRGAVGILTTVLARSPKNTNALWFRGQSYQTLKEYRAAIGDFTAYLEITPKSASALTRRAQCYNRLKENRNAYSDYARGAEVDPKSVSAANGLAWLLATCPDARFRDGKEAVEAGRRACDLSGWKEPMYFDTLAAAYAEAGDFTQAVEWQTKALADPTALEKVVGKDGLAQARFRLDLFKKRMTFRE